MSQIVSSQNIITSSAQSVLISTSTGTSVGLPGQGPQQFLLVRTIIQPGVNQSGMRLILPASVYSPQRPAAPQAITVNGNGLNCSPPATGTAVQSNDILLKAVLGSGIGGETIAQTVASDGPKNCAKSSPLLNVLLDKGKFPDASGTPAAAAPVQSQTTHDRVYILTTGSQIKAANHNEVIPLKNGISADVVTTASNASKPKTCVVNCVNEPILTNGDISVPHQTDVSDKKSLPVTDLSPLKDMQKAVDDAPKLISKRPADDANQTPAKKSRLNEVTECPEEAVKPTAKILPVNGEIKIPPKISPEKSTVAGEVIRTNVVPVTNPAVPPVLEYVCEWNECKRSFSRASHVFKHVYESHVFCEGVVPKHCVWGGPDGMGPGCLSERPQLSLLTHLQDFHCNASILHQAALKRQQFGNTITSLPVMPVPAPPAHPGYAQNAALLAIRRLNCIEPVSVPASTATTPITVSIRLTAALIIRNLATISGDVRRCLQRHERYLSEMCVAPGRDESRTIAQCLALIQNNTWRR